MTAAVLSPDLQRIVEALQACRERYELRLGIRFGNHHVWDLVDDVSVCNGTRSECLAYIDARCAEAVVRAIREPGEAALGALAALLDGPGIRMEGPSARSRRRAEDAWAGTIDAILGETQP